MPQASMEDLATYPFKISLNPSSKFSATFELRDCLPYCSENKSLWLKGEGKDASFVIACLPVGMGDVSVIKHCGGPLHTIF
jgi:hypothetical protein